MQCISVILVFEKFEIELGVLLFLQCQLIIQIPSSSFHRFPFFPNSDIN